MGAIKEFLKGGLQAVLVGVQELFEVPVVMPPKNNLGRTVSKVPAHGWFRAVEEIWGRGALLFGLGGLLGLLLGSFCGNLHE